MFNFRIVNTPDGNQIIDRSLKTPEESLNAVSLLEYMEVDAAMLALDRASKNKKGSIIQKLVETFGI